MDKKISVHKLKPILIQKYGGATLSHPQKIKSVAQKIKAKVKQGYHLIIVVSAMGNTTDELLALAHQVSARPQRRELDMLLTVGERVSMSLLSMALNDIECTAISFTGSQAGIFTNDSHVTAMIQDIKAFRIEETLQQYKIPVIAGFQGVNPHNKEITTLGRGGSDTSAIAIAAFFEADQCEILKEVTGVFSGDPQKISSAQLIPQLNYDQLLEMTFWGAKVIHYRAVELAKMKNVKIFVGPAHDDGNANTIISKGLNMYETSKALALNTHDDVIQIIQTTNQSLSISILELLQILENKQIPNPQVLWSTYENNTSHIFLTGPKEVLSAIRSEFSDHSEFKIDNKKRSTVALTCTGVTSSEVTKEAIDELKKSDIEVEKVYLSAMSLVFLIEQKDLIKASEVLHNLI